MRRILFALALLAGLFLLAVPPASACKRLRVSVPLHTRLAVADVAVFGEVTAVERETIDCERYPGAGNKQENQIAVVRVTRNLHGAANVTHVKVAFVPNYSANARMLDDFDDGGRLPTLDVGQRFCFFLKRVPDSGVYSMPYDCPPVEITDKTEDPLDRLAEDAVGLQNPAKALASTDADLRLMTARLLTLRYRTQRAGDTEQVAISKDESQLILKAFAELSWTLERTDMNTQTVFSRLSLSAADKYQPGAADPNGDPTAPQRTELQRWLAAEGATYQIKKFAPKQ